MIKTLGSLGKNEGLSQIAAPAIFLSDLQRSFLFLKSIPLFPILSFILFLKF